MCSISPDMLGAAAAEATPYPWKLWGRMNGSQLEYAVNSSLWDGSAWGGSVAGEYVNPIGVTASVTAKAWTSATAGGVYAHLSASAGSIAVTFDQTPASASSFYASPGIYDVHLGNISADGSVERLVYGTFHCLPIPAFFAGYAADKWQIPYHPANGNMAWRTVEDCATGADYTE